MMRMMMRIWEWTIIIESTDRTKERSRNTRVATATPLDPPIWDFLARLCMFTVSVTDDTIATWLQNMITVSGLGSSGHGSQLLSSGHGSQLLSITIVTQIIEMNRIESMSSKLEWSDWLTKTVNKRVISLIYVTTFKWLQATLIIYIHQLGQADGDGKRMDK